MSAREHDYSVRVLADLELGLGEDHPVGGDPAELGASELLASGHHRPREGHGHGLPGGDVGGATDDRARGVARFHLADGQPIGVGVGLDPGDPSDHEVFRGGRPQVGDPFHLGRPQRQELAQLLGAQLGITVLAKP